MENIESYSAAEKKCEDETILALKQPIEINEELFEFYLKISKKYCGGMPKSNVRPFALIVLNHRILKSTRCLSTLLKRGQYAEFHSILRDVFEALSKSEFFLSHPESSHAWLKGEKITFSKISKKLSLPDSLNQLYGELCNFTHANIQSIFWEITVYPKKIEPNFRIVSMSYEPVFFKPIAYSLIMFLIDFTIYAINSYFIFIERYCSEIDQEDKDQYYQLTKKLAAIDKDYSEFCSDPKNTEWRRKIKFNDSNPDNISF